MLQLFEVGRQRNFQFLTQKAESDRKSKTKNPKATHFLCATRLYFLETLNTRLCCVAKTS